MENAYQYENELMDEAFAELKSRHVFSAELRDKLLKIFGDRFTNGLELANSRRVRKYEFKPSRRVVWVVKGRTNEYQIIPDLPFCYCDDYYFRVMDRKRGLCYHIVAQRIAEALDQFQTVQKSDLQYSTITDRWRAKEVSRD
jgi:predicted nucleic acid-binding Zn finger protein